MSGCSELPDGAAPVRSWNHRTGTSSNSISWKPTLVVVRRIGGVSVPTKMDPRSRVSPRRCSCQTSPREALPPGGARSHEAEATGSSTGTLDPPIELRKEAAAPGQNRAGSSACVRVSRKASRDGGGHELPPIRAKSVIIMALTSGHVYQNKRAWLKAAVTMKSFSPLKHLRIMSQTLFCTRTITPAAASLSSFWLIWLPTNDVSRQLNQQETEKGGCDVAAVSGLTCEEAAHRCSTGGFREQPVKNE